MDISVHFGVKDPNYKLEENGRIIRKIIIHPGYDLEGKIRG